MRHNLSTLFHTGTVRRRCMKNPAVSIQRGYDAFRRGSLDEARRALRNVNHPKAVHLLGLVEERSGNANAAKKLLARAAKLAPDDAEVALNRARVAATREDHTLAASEYRRALRLRPGNRDARYGLATALLESDRPGESLHLLESLMQDGHDQPAIRFMRGRARLQNGDIDGAIDDLSRACDDLRNPVTLKALANVYWMSGDENAFRALIDRAAQDPQLAVDAASLLRETGDPESAIQNLQDVGEDPLAAWVRATAYIDLGDGENAEVAARQGLGKAPGDASLARALIVSLLMQGHADAALPLIRDGRLRYPDDQLWIAYEASALRQVDEDAYRHLVDMDRFVRGYRISPPSGYADVDEFNSALRNALDNWHAFGHHPIGQSLRHGSQTVRDLTKIDDPVIRSFYSALDVPIRQYLEDIGRDATHPTTARNAGRYRFSGGWSVKLAGGGNHVSHVHPDGWISSSYYVEVPDPGPGERAGSIKFGEPPFATDPASPAERWIAPEAGMLVLFPSFLWHGTEPTADNTIRITAPFDILPAD